MVVVSILPHAEFGVNDHQKDAHHFILTEFIFTVNIQKCDISQGIDRNLIICTDEEWDIKNLISAETGAQVTYNLYQKVIKMSHII